MLFYQLIGDPNLQKILLLHGFLGSCEDFKLMIRYLPSSFCYLIVDLPGHGKSTSFSPFLKSYFLKKIKKIICKHRCIGCLGYSLGGRLALELDYRYPFLFKQLMILSSHPGLDPQKRKKRKKEDFILGKKMTESPSDFLKQWYNAPMFSSLDSEELIKKRECNDFDQIKKALICFSMGSQRSFWGHILRSKNKYLFLAGEEDIKYRKLYKKLNAKVELIKSASHALILEKPEICANYVLNFFSNPL
jgi:2-succinyl-6-hydroxy-2,4-cyclohexadiene-1-carboxylate synthase